MNKKAGFFALLIVLFTFILSGYALYTFTLAKAKVDTSVNSPLEIIEFNQEIEKQEIYDQQKLEMESVQAFHELFVEGAMKANENCKFTGGYIIFNDNCEPNENEIAEIFIEKLETKKEMEDYSFSFSEKNTKLVAGKEINEELKLDKAFADYVIKYNQNKEYIIDLNEKGISFSEVIKMYNEASRCKESENMNACVKIDAWELGFEEQDYKFFTFITKDYYYYYDNREIFSPIEFRFALE